MVRSKPWPAYSLAQVAAHAHKDDCWIVVDDKVYDMTPHVRNHEGWIGSGKISTLLAILSAMGTDCTDDFAALHSAKANRPTASRTIFPPIPAPSPSPSPAPTPTPTVFPHARPALAPQAWKQLDDY